MDASAPAQAERLSDIPSPMVAPKPAKGKWVVLGLVALGLVAATGAWLWNYHRGRRALAFFGGQTAWLIRRAPQVELWMPKRPLAEGETPPPSHKVVVLDQARWLVQRRVDLSRTPGMLNARTSLLEDASFQAAPPQRYAGPPPQTWLRFADQSQEAWVAIQDDLVILPERGLALPLVPKTARGWGDFLQRQLRAHPSPQAEEAPGARR